MTMRARGLKESQRAWGNMARGVEKGFRLELVGFGNRIVEDGRGRLASRVGGYRMRRFPGALGSEVSGASALKAVVFIERQGAMPAAEFGAKTHTVFGRSVSQRSMKSRTAGGWSRKGNIVGPEFTAIKARKRQRRLADRGLRDIRKTLNKYGVPR